MVPSAPVGILQSWHERTIAKTPRGTLAPWRTLVGNTEALASVTALSIHIYIQ